MPKGIKGFQKGHKGFVPKDKYKEIGAKVSVARKKLFATGKIKVSEAFDYARRHPKKESIEKARKKIIEQFKNGRKNQWEGKKMPVWLKQKLSKVHIGIQAGNKHPNWKGGRKINDSGYILIYCPNHPNCDALGYVREHRLIMEKKIGRPLLKTEVVHHVDENKQNNHPSNLMLFSSNNEHIKHHQQIKRQ